MRVIFGHAKFICILNFAEIINYVYSHVEFLIKEIQEIEWFRISLLLSSHVSFLSHHARVIWR